MKETEAARQADLAAIEELHRADRAAAQAGDAEALRAIWTDDIVVLPPAGEIVAGKQANYDALLAQLQRLQGQTITEYVLSFEEVEVVGDCAFEWGTYRGTARTDAGGEERRTTGKLMRVLRKGGDGRWRVARSIWTADAPATTSV